METVLMRYLLLPALIALTGCVSGELKTDRPVDMSLERGSVELGDQKIGSEIPHEMNSAVLKWMDYFQGRGRRHMKRYLARSTKYLPMMKKTLREEGLPEDLVYVALIESGFSSSARSHANAVGHWQFIRGTGRAYGLRINSVLDERRDAVKATRSAAKYLKSLHLLFDDWYLAIASYNVGENRVKRLVMKYRTRDFWELARRRKLPRETINYVPKYLAARMIGKNPEKYGFTDVNYQPEWEFDTLETKFPVNLRKLASHAKISYSGLKDLNPAFRTEYAPVDKEGILRVKLPKGTLAHAQTVTELARVKNTSKLNRMMASKWIRYRVRRGDTLSQIAQKHRTSVSTLKRINHLGRRSFIRVGQRLNVPIYPTRRAYASLYKARTQPIIGDGEKVHRVRKGETLSQIAERYKIGLSKVLKANRLTMRSRIKVGQRIIIPGKKKAATSRRARNIARASTGKSYTVKRGDTLIGIAQRYNMTLGQLRSLNNLTRKSKIYIGQKLSLKNDSSKNVHVVRRGETLSHISSKYNVSVRKLASANGLSNNHKVRIGHKIVIPD